MSKTSKFTSVSSFRETYRATKEGDRKSLMKKYPALAIALAIQYSITNPSRRGPIGLSIHSLSDILGVEKKLLKKQAIQSGVFEDKEHMRFTMIAVGEETGKTTKHGSRIVRIKKSPWLNAYDLPLMLMKFYPAIYEQYGLGDDPMEFVRMVSSK